MTDGCNLTAMNEPDAESTALTSPVGGEGEGPLLGEELLHLGISAEFSAMPLDFLVRQARVIGPSLPDGWTMALEILLGSAEVNDCHISSLTIDMRSTRKRAS